MDDVLIKFRSDLAEFRKDLDSVKKDLGDVGKKATDAGKKAEDGFKKADSATDKLTTGLKGLGTVLTAAFATQQIISFAKEAVELAKQAEGIKVAFAKLNDPNLLKQLRDATKGAVSDVSLMKAAVQANNFKIPLDQLGKLFSFAAQRARDTGESVDYLTESIVLGISRKSIPILDNLGLSATEIQNEFKKTGDFAIATGNIIDREMAKAGDSTELAGETVDRTSARWENFKEKIGSVLLDGLEPFSTVVGAAILNLDELLFGVDENTTAFDEFGNAIQRTTLAIQMSQRDQISLSIALLESRKALVESAGGYGNAIQDLNKLIDEQKKQLELLDAAEKDNNETKEKTIALNKEEEKTLKDIEIIRKRTLKDFQKDRLKAIDDANKEEEAANKKLNDQLNSDDTKARLEQAQKDMDIQRKTYEADVDGNKKANEEKERQDEQYRQASFMVAQSIADAALELNRRTREAETDDKIKSLEKQRDAELNYRGATEADKSRINAEFDEKRKKILRDNFEAQKRASIIEANIQGALAVIAALPNYVLAAAVGVTTGIQLALIASQPTPEFHTGGVDINPKRKNKKGEFDAKLIEGESVVHAKATKQWKNELKAMNEMKFEDYVLSKYVVPALRVQQQEVLKHQNNSLARNMANSIMLNQGFNDGNIVEMLKRVNSSTKENSKILSKGFRSKRTHLRG